MGVLEKKDEATYEATSFSSFNHRDFMNKSPKNGENREKLGKIGPSMLSHFSTSLSGPPSPLIWTQVLSILRAVLLWNLAMSRMGRDGEKNRGKNSTEERYGTNGHEACGTPSYSLVMKQEPRSRTSSKEREVRRLLPRVRLILH